MPLPDRIEGLAIVSADGMIADRDGIQPPSLKLEADQRLFHRMLDEATALLHGRNSAEGGPFMARRRRIVVTRNVAGVERDHANAVRWNPAGASLEQAWDALGLSGGLLTVIGGTEPFGLFLDRYDTFHLTRAGQARLPGGRPVFPGIPPQSAEQLLTRHGLRPGAMETLDAAQALTLVSWRR